jgi:hypothetical protein
MFDPDDEGRSIAHPDRRLIEQRVRADDLPDVQRWPVGTRRRADIGG